jgi:hypothetical protein
MAAEAVAHTPAFEMFVACFQLRNRRRFVSACMSLSAGSYRLNLTCTYNSVVVNKGP